MADEKNVPMGGDLFEETRGRAEPLDNRNCWAIDVLVEEVTALFQTEAETSEPNWLNANTVVTFSPATTEWEDMALVLPVLEDDERVASLAVDEKKGTMTVSIVANAILYDTRDTFGLDSAVLGLDREITADDLTEVAHDLVRGDEGFTEGSL